MTWRVIYAHPGHFAPCGADFRYRQAAEVMRDIARDAGAEDAEVVEIGGDSAERPGNGPWGYADRVKVPEGDREGDRAANRATATKGSK